MSGSPFAGIPALPPSEVEWEEVLLRFDIFPRGLRAALDELPAGRWRVPTAAGAGGAEGRLAALAAREAGVTGWMEALREGGVLEALPEAGGADTPEAHLSRFSLHRARNFAMVQRRGLEVWEWRARLPTGEPVTAFQLLSRLVREDAEWIREIRSALRESGPC